MVWYQVYLYDSNISCHYCYETSFLYLTTSNYYIGRAAYTYEQTFPRLLLDSSYLPAASF